MPLVTPLPMKVYNYIYITIILLSNVYIYTVYVFFFYFFYICILILQGCVHMTGYQLMLCMCCLLVASFNIPVNFLTNS